MRPIKPQLVEAAAGVEMRQSFYDPSDLPKIARRLARSVKPRGSKGFVWNWTLEVSNRGARVVVCYFARPDQHEALKVSEVL